MKCVEVVDHRQKAAALCHGDNQAGQQRLAPPFAMVKMHYQNLDEKTFIKTVSAWVKEPEKQKSKMPGAINRFGLMPSFAFPEAEVTAIAKYVFDTDFQMPGYGGGGGRMGQGKGGQGGGACGSGTDAGAKSGAGCGEGCEPGKSSVNKTAAGSCNTCEMPKEDTTTASAEAPGKPDSETTATKKWPVPPVMTSHIQKLEKDLAGFENKTPGDHAELAKRIKENLKQLISSCTMEGEAHNALHEWLMPFRELAKQHAESSDPAVQIEKIREMRRAFRAFHEQFEPAPQP